MAQSCARRLGPDGLRTGYGRFRVDGQPAPAVTGREAEGGLADRTGWARPGARLRLRGPLVCWLWGREMRESARPYGVAD